VYSTEDTYEKTNLLSRGQTIDFASGGGGSAPADVVSDVLSPGQFSVHHLGIAHGGGPNAGADRRIGFNVTYIRPSVRSVRLEGGAGRHIP
jgi:hypothetical protein